MLGQTRFLLLAVLVIAITKTQGHDGSDPFRQVKELTDLPEPALKTADDDAGQALRLCGYQRGLTGDGGIIDSGKKEITQQEISDALYNNLPEPDLIVRTSGEQRLSNFLLWQAAYSEFYFTPVLWPDFKEEHFIQAVEEYGRRQRRFGGR